MGSYHIFFSQIKEVRSRNNLWLQTMYGNKRLVKWSSRWVIHDWWSLTQQTWWQRGPSELQQSRSYAGGSVDPPPTDLLPVFHGCLLTSAYTIPTVSGDVPAPTTLLHSEIAAHVSLLFKRKGRSCWHLQLSISQAAVPTKGLLSITCSSSERSFWYISPGSAQEQMY